MSRVHITPSELDSIIRRFEQFQREITSKLQDNRRYVEQLQNSWGDDQYKQFKEQYEEFTRRMLPETETRLANITEFLRNCKKQAEAYQNIQMRK